jgi:hypothetical protein
MHTKFSDYFKISIDLVKSLKIDYLIIGGIAVGILGEPRFTADVDIIIFIPKQDIRILLNKAKEFGFKFDEKTVINDAMEKGVFRIFYNQYHLDFIIASTELEKLALKRKYTVKIYNRKIFIPSKEDMILFKVIPNREKDLVDAQSIVMRHKNKLDVKYLKRWAEKLSEEAQDMRIYNTIVKLLNL